MKGFSTSWSVYLPNELPTHAPTNAAFGRPTKWFSTLGGKVFEWLDENGFELGESNSVPPNFWGESTIRGSFVEPKKQVIFGLELYILQLQLEAARRGIQLVLLSGDGYLTYNDNFFKGDLPEDIRIKLKRAEFEAIRLAKKPYEDGRVRRFLSGWQVARLGNQSFLNENVPLPEWKSLFPRLRYIPLRAASVGDKRVFIARVQNAYGNEKFSTYFKDLDPNALVKGPFWEWFYEDEASAKAVFVAIRDQNGYVLPRDIVGDKTWCKITQLPVEA